MATNQILPFCSTDTGTNLPTQGDYAVDANRAIGNSPGIASLKLNNKPLRQATFIASQLAQYVSDKTGNDVLDDAVSAKLLAIMNAAFLPIAPVYTKYLSGSGTHNSTFYFFTTTASATIGATYTNNGNTFTVKSTISSGTVLELLGNGSPSVSGTLTKASGTGDATISFYSVRKPLLIKVRGIAGGGGGGGSGTVSSGGTGGNGNDTTFGTSLFSASGGIGAAYFTAGAGGSASISSPATGISLVGGSGMIFGGNPGAGGECGFGGAGSGGILGVGQGVDAASSTGAGGGGGGYTQGATNGGGGGGAGGLFEGFLNISNTFSWSYSVGSGGLGGVAGSGGGNAQPGGAGGSGFIDILEIYQ